MNKWGFLFFFIYSCNLCGQLIEMPINESVLPSPEYYIVHNNNLSGIDFGEPDKNQVWDFSILETPIVDKNVLSKDIKSKEKSFLSTAHWMNANVHGREYFELKNNKLFTLGYEGFDPLHLGINKTIQYDEPLKLYEFPIIFGESHEGEGRFEVILKESEIPNDILNILPLTPDKMKIQHKIKYIADWDAQGTVKLPYSKEPIEVFREKRFVTVETKVLIKFGFFSWIDVSSFYKNFEGKGFGTPEKYINYLYWEKDNSLPLVCFSMVSEDGFSKKASYRMPFLNMETEQLSNNQPSFDAFPNPSYGDFSIEISNQPKGKYTIQLMNIIGQVVFQKDIYFTANTSLPIDVIDIPKGTYLYSLVDEYGKTISTKKIIIHKP